MSYIANTKLIKSARIFIGYTQKELAEYLELNINSYGAKERGDKQFMATELYRMSKLFNDKGFKCDMEDFVIEIEE